MAPQDSRRRELDVADELRSYYEYRERWAVLVGISKYQHASWGLNFADRDAGELAKLLKQSAFGSFDESRMCILLNEEATTAAITKALRSFLKRPSRSDLVLLHFSCHGTPDPDGLDDVYLVTHDTDPADIAATAVPMREVRHALEHTLKAERVVILADTCHSAALGGGGRKSVTPTAAVMRHYLQAIGESRPGRAWLMSAEANEVSFEDTRWGGGHGLFTYHLIEGLKGAADPENRGLVKVGNLFDHVHERVIADSGQKQHPSKGLDGFDRDLVLAVTTHLNMREHYEIGRLLEEMGRLLDDPRRFESASRQLERAFALSVESGASMPEAALACGLARLSAADGDHALSWFEKAEKTAEEADPPDTMTATAARFYRVLALLDRKRPLREPLGALDDFLARHPTDGWASCAREMREKIDRADRSRRYALLIGIARFQDSTMSSLAGPENDVKEIRQVLIDRFGFLPDDVATLQGQGATREAILFALQALADRAGPEDVAVVYFSGHGISGRSEPYWAPYDFARFQYERALTSSEIHRSLGSIPAVKTVVIIDTEANEILLELARRDRSYTLLLGASPGEHASDLWPADGLPAVSHGAFTWGLLRALRQGDPSELTPRLILDRVIKGLGRQGFGTDREGGGASEVQQAEVPRGTSRTQTPLVVGQEDEILFRSLPDFPELFRFSRRRNHSALTPAVIGGLERRAGLLVDTIPGFRRSLGRGYLEADQPNEAIRVLELAVDEKPLGSGGIDPQLTLTCAYTICGRHEDARRVWAKADRSWRSPATSSGQEAWANFKKLVTSGGIGRRALLVGINAYAAPEIPNPRGALADVDALANVLRQRWGFTEIRVLTDAAATRAAILKGVRQLAEHSRDVPCLFAFSGVGSEDAEGRLSLVAADSRLTGDVYDDIDLAELVQIARETPGDLITIVDAGWTNIDQLAQDQEARSRGRTAPRNLRPRPMTRDLSSEETRSLEGLDLNIGRLAIYSPSLQVASSTRWAGGDVAEGLDAEDEQSDPEPGGADRKIFGLLSHALARALWELDPTTATLGDWIDASGQGLVFLPLRAPSYKRDEPIFGTPSRHTILETVMRIEREPIAELIPRLKRLLDTQDLPETHLNLGLTYAALGEYEGAVEALEQAGNHEETTASLRAEAQYHLGRVLYEGGIDLDRSISALRRATEQESTPAGAFYYLGRALRDLAERDLQALSAAMFRNYMNAGAPLGHRDQVLGWIESGRNAPAMAVAGLVSKSAGERSS